MPSRRFFTRLFGSDRELAALVSRLSRQIDEQRRDLQSLAATIHKQAEQLKDIRGRQAAADERWTAALDRLADGMARLTREHAADRRRAEHEREGLDHLTRTQARLVREHADERVANEREREKARAAAVEARKLDLKWRNGFAWQLAAVVRKLYLPADIPMPFRLAARRFKLRSQHEEDGYLLALLEEIGTTDRRFVEIGCGRSGGNAALLAFEMGWHGLMIDANPEAIDYVDRVHAFNESVTGVLAEVSAANVNTLLAEHGFTGEVDLLSIDIDSYDYWVLEALDVCSPRLLMLEYNAGFGPTRAVTIPRDQSLAGTPKGYGGASLAALTALAARKGYRLVACEYSGANAFFLRDDVASHIPAQPVARAYRPQMSRYETDQERAIGPDELFRRIGERGLPLVDV